MSTTLIEQGVPFTDWRARVQQRLHTARSHDGFSLLELVVAVSIMLILAVVGFIAYQGLTDNARQAAVDSSTNQVLTAVIAADNAPNGDDPKKVVEDYNGTSDGIVVNITEASGGENGKITIKAEDKNGTKSEMSAPGDYSHLTGVPTDYELSSGE